MQGGTFTWRKWQWLAQKLSLPTRTPPATKNLKSSHQSNLVQYYDFTIAPTPHIFYIILTTDKRPPCAIFFITLLLFLVWFGMVWHGLCVILGKKKVFLSHLNFLELLLFWWYTLRSTAVLQYYIQKRKLLSISFIYSIPWKWSWIDRD